MRETCKHPNKQWLLCRSNCECFRCPDCKLINRCPNPLKGEELEKAREEAGLSMLEALCERVLGKKNIK